MKISVIITTYNRPDALLKVLEGLQLQTRLPDEVRIADDGSGRETKASIIRFSKTAKYPISHDRQEDDGFRAARIRNKAIKQSTGEYIILLDGDCIPDKHLVSDYLELAEQGCFFQGKRVLIDRALSRSFSALEANSAIAKLKYFFSGRVSNRHHLLRLTMFPAHKSESMSGTRSCNMGFFRKDIYAVNGFNEEFVGWGREDSELVARFYTYGLKRKTHPFMAVVFHLWHEDNSRNKLQANDDLLRKTVEYKTIKCRKGLNI
ncbi:MAG: glycosyltransferase family 2 protein [Desulfobacterales bacterium]|nr:glycosyltransferase family 2 protein [Desulfobacterales bacterium]